MHPIDRVHNKIAAGFVLNLYGEWVARNTALAAKQQLLQHVFAGDVDLNGQWVPLKQAVSGTVTAPVSNSEQTSSYTRTYNETYVEPGPVFHKGYVKSNVNPQDGATIQLEHNMQHVADVILKRTIQLNADTVLTISEADIMMNKIVVFAIDGYLDQSNCSHVSDELVSRIQGDVRFIICDLSRSTLITSAGWGMLAAVKGQLTKVHGDFYVTAMPAEIEESFRLLQFGAVLKKSFSVNDCLIKIKVTIQRSMIESATSYVPGERLQAPSGAPLPSEMPLQEKVKAVISHYGPVSVFEMKKILNEKEFGKEMVGLIKLYKLLREINLDTKAKQVRFYRSC
jgi:anti-anti-sigma regulatory factor